MKIKPPKKFDASDKRISDLIFKARQYNMWAGLEGRPMNERKAHLRKSLEAAKALKSLGYMEDIFDY